MARKIQDIVKGQKLQVLEEDSTVQQACQCMSEHGVGSVVVTDEQHRLTGIFTGRDAVRLLARGESAERTPLSKAMTHNPATIGPEKLAIEEIVLDGRISTEDFDAVASRLEAFINRHGHVRLLEVIREFEGMDARALWHDIQFSCDT